jgi:hypothetical protein
LSVVGVNCRATRAELSRYLVTGLDGLSVGQRHLANAALMVQIREAFVALDDAYGLFCICSSHCAVCNNAHEKIGVLGWVNPKAG